MKKRIFFYLGLIFLISGIAIISAADFGYTNREKPQLLPEINYSLIPTVNASEWWIGTAPFDDETDIPGYEFWYNHSLFTEGKFVPYVGATDDVNLGTHTLSAKYLVAGYDIGIGSGAIDDLSLYFSSDPDTGFYLSSSNDIGFVTGGAEQITLNMVSTDFKDNNIITTGNVTADFIFGYFVNATNVTAEYFFGNGSMLTDLNESQFNDDFLNLSGTNANQNIDIGLYNFSSDDTIEGRKMIAGTGNGYEGRTFEVSDEGWIQFRIGGENHNQAAGMKFENDDSKFASFYYYGSDYAISRYQSAFVISNYNGAGGISFGGGNYNAVFALTNPSTYPYDRTLFIPNNNSKLYFGDKLSSGYSSIMFDGTNMVFISNETALNSIAWFSSDISVNDTITRTSVYDKNRGSALDYIQDSDYYLSPDNSINHSKFYGGTKYEVTDYSRPELMEACDINPDTDEQECHEETYYPYTKIEEGVSLNAEIDVLRQATYEQQQIILQQNQTINELKARIEALESPTPQP